MPNLLRLDASPDDHSRVYASMVSSAKSLLLSEVINERSCKDCIAAFLVTCEEKGEVRRCPTCSQGPVNVGPTVLVLNVVATN
jgi:uncharacterized protein (UPF0332 family)